MPGEGGAEPVFRYAPEIVLDAIDQGNRNFFPVLTQIFFRLRDITFLPGQAEILSHPANHLARIVTEVTAWPAEQRDPGRRHSGASVTSRPGTGPVPLGGLEPRRPRVRAVRRVLVRLAELAAA